MLNDIIYLKKTATHTIIEIWPREWMSVDGNEYRSLENIILYRSILCVQCVLSFVSPCLDFVFVVWVEMLIYALLNTQTQTKIWCKNISFSDSRDKIVLSQNVSTQTVHTGGALVEAFTFTLLALLKGLKFVQIR